jgi:hypothetical protein
MRRGRITPVPQARRYLSTKNLVYETRICGILCPHVCNHSRLHQQTEKSCSIPLLYSVHRYVKHCTRYGCRKILKPGFYTLILKAMVWVFAKASCAPGVGRASSSKKDAFQSSLTEYLRVSTVVGIRGRLHRRSPRMWTSTSRLQAKCVMPFTNILNRDHKNSVLRESLKHIYYVMLPG